MAVAETIEKLRGLILSAVELRDMIMTDGRFTEEFIEDYLNIFQELITIITELNNVINQTAKSTRTVSSSFLISADDGTIFCDTTNNDIDAQLPPGVSGEVHKIINTGLTGNIVTIYPDGFELLNGFNASEPLYNSENLSLQYEPTEGWY
jgi:hypothetical protein